MNPYRRNIIDFSRCVARVFAVQEPTLQTQGFEFCKRLNDPKIIFMPLSDGLVGYIHGLLRDYFIMLQATTNAHRS